MRHHPPPGEADAPPPACAALCCTSFPLEWPQNVWGRSMGRIIDFAQYRQRAASAVSTVARLTTSEKARSARINLELDAMSWIERHGPYAYGLARDRIHEAWRLGDHEAAVRWQAIRDMVGRLEGRRIGPAPERE